MNFKDCKIAAKNGLLEISNSFIYRSWTIRNGLCYSLSLRDNINGNEYLTGESENPAPGPDFIIEDDCRKTSYKIFKAADSVVEEESLRIDVISEYSGYSVISHFKIYPKSPAISQWLTMSGHVPKGKSGVGADDSVDNIEDLRSLVNSRNNMTGLCDMLKLDRVHKKLGIADFMAHTDRKDNLCYWREDLITIHTSNSYSSNLIYFHDQISENGLVFLKEAPLPHARPIKSNFDLLRDGGEMFFTGHGSDDLTRFPGYPFTVILYSGGSFGRIKALHNYQRKFRVYNEKRDNVIWHSTWGDRNTDKIVSAEFMLKELEDMKKAGGDFLYFSDGWQKGAAMTSLTMERYMGQWSKDGYWDADMDKFPNDLTEVTEVADELGMMKGMWFCPDQTNEYENYEKDIETVIALYKRYGFNKVKYDAMTFRTKLAEERVKKIMAALVEESDGDAFVEIDITAGIRTDYFDAMQYGFLFLENRYTDFRRYYPHCTLRNLWLLSHFVDPRRLRIEFLNNERNKDKYPNDPLAPCHYSADYLYVSTIFANPLMWFEISNLSDEYKKQMKEIIALCRPIRLEIAQSNVYPIGDEPDGFSMSGFMSVDEIGGGYAAVFRAVGEQDSQTMELPLKAGNYEFKLLSGSGSDFLCNSDSSITFRIPEKYGYSLYRFYNDSTVHRAFRFGDCTQITDNV